jgi:hypothetical protein
MSQVRILPPEPLSRSISASAMLRRAHAVFEELGFDAEAAAVKSVLSIDDTTIAFS